MIIFADDYYYNDNDKISVVVCGFALIKLLPLQFCVTISHAYRVFYSSRVIFLRFSFFASFFFCFQKIFFSLCSIVYLFIVLNVVVERKYCLNKTEK